MLQEKAHVRTMDQFPYHFSQEYETRLYISISMKHLSKSYEGLSQHLKNNFLFVEAKHKVIDPTGKGGPRESVSIHHLETLL